MRGLTPGTDAISPSTFQDLENEDDIDAALRVGVDYIILDGRGGGGRARPRSCFVTTFRCRPFPRGPEPGDISTPVAVATSRW